MAVLEDRVSAKPGRMLIKPEDGAEFYATLEMADEPVTPGNKINRQNVIDTLLPMSESGGVGTVIFSTVQNPDERWLPCDGREIKAAENPELYAVLPEVPIQSKSVKFLDTVGLYTINRVKYLNGYYIAMGTVSKSTSGFAYSESLEGPWQIVTGACEDIIYAKGYWVRLASGVPYYATAPDGDWTKCTGTNSSGRQLIFHNDYFYDIDTNYIYRAAFPADEWESRVKWSDVVESGNHPSLGPIISYNESYKRWEKIFYKILGNKSEGYKQTCQIAHSLDLENWTLGVSYTWDAELYKSYTNAGVRAYLGVDGSYWVVGMYFDSTSSPTLEIYEDGTVNSITDVQLDSGCSIFGKGEIAKTGSSIKLCVRSGAGEAFIETDIKIPGYNLSNEQPVNEQIILGLSSTSTSSVDDLCVFDAPYLHYLPSITVPDANGVTNAYIKAK